MTAKIRLFIFLILGIALILPAFSFSEGQAADDTLSSDFFEDFDETNDFGPATPETTETEKTDKKQTAVLPSFLKLNGDLTLTVVDNISHKKPAAGETDWRDLSSLRAELFLEADIEFPGSWEAKISGSGFYDSVYSLKDREDYDKRLLNEEEADAELRKAWISGKLLNNLDIKLGRQIVVWGKSDNIRVTDVLNPVNMEIPGMADLEDTRLPVFMTKLDYYLSSFRISALAVHEKRFNELPAPGSDFFIFSILENAVPTATLTENEPSENLSNTEYGFSVNGTFSGWGASLYYADYYVKNFYFHIDSFPYTYSLKHAHQSMAGADINIALGNFLLKGEAAYKKNVRFSDYMEQRATIYRREVQRSFSTIQSLGGIEYTGFRDTTITLETMNTFVRDLDEHTKEANVSKNSWETSVRLDRNFMNERLSTTILAFLYGESLDEGTMLRLTADYDLTDNFVITLGAILYDSNEIMLLESIKNNDRIYSKFEYTF